MRFLDYTQWRTTVGRTPLNEWSVHRRDLSTWHHTTLTTNVHAASGIWTHDPSRRVAADLRLWPCGHWDQPVLICMPNHQFINGSYGMFSVIIVVTLCTDRFTTRNTALCSWCTYVLHMMMTINRGCFPVQHSKSGHSNERILCSLCIT
jgi:hypothetical protein